MSNYRNFTRKQKKPCNFTGKREFLREKQFYSHCSVINIIYLQFSPVNLGLKMMKMALCLPDVAKKTTHDYYIEYIVAYCISLSGQVYPKTNMEKIPFPVFHNTTTQCD